MPIPNFHGNTFVAFTDISGFKELMNKDADALQALERFYQAGYNALRHETNVHGFFISDCGILFGSGGNVHERLVAILKAIKNINKRMLEFDYVLTTSIAYGLFDYEGKLEFVGIDKSPIYGNAYLNAFLDNEKGIPKIQPGQCRLIINNLPENINLNHEDFKFLQPKSKDPKHQYFYWNLNSVYDVTDFEVLYNDSYKLKYSGMIDSLKKFQ
jgi:hypothetical protein